MFQRLLRSGHHPNQAWKEATRFVSGRKKHRGKTKGKIGGVGNAAR